MHVMDDWRVVKGDGHRMYGRLGLGLSSRRRLWCTAVILGCCLVAGCGQRGPARGMVRGRVTIGDRPVTDARVVFSNADTGAALQVPLDDDGAYEARTYQGPGLVAGTYGVAIIPGTIRYSEENQPKMTSDQFKVRNAATSAAQASEISKKYASAETSGLSIVVKEGDNPPFDFKLVP